mgnify:FL=1
MTKIYELVLKHSNSIDFDVISLVFTAHHMRSVGFYWLILGLLINIVVT